MRSLTINNAENVIELLQDEIRRSEESRYNHRLHAVLLVSQGLSPPEAADWLGDSVRAVNWRATARTGELHTNEFDPTSLAAVRLLLDVGSLYRPWEAINPELMEVLCVVGASLAAAFSGRGFAVGLACNAALATGIMPCP